ncbi:hypothetical protein O6H91_22G006800 [Diphasiastrum complanatum]|uniref:Uncharacterized protein n=1 Tax=Diphasiastrum complanatum TaxID=34168 RepID=A0ACC2ACF4_DIPCM|nr:hypothetical protein O6H91_22G006800 [Diphasiastrum complanatum]
MYSRQIFKLELVMSLYILATIHCWLGQYEDAIVVLERSLALSNTTSQSEHALASFSGYMQVCDNFALLLVRHESSVDTYHATLSCISKILESWIRELETHANT